MWPPGRRCARSVWKREAFLTFPPSLSNACTTRLPFFKNAPEILSEINEEEWVDFRHEPDNPQGQTCRKLIQKKDHHKIEWKVCTKHLRGTGGLRTHAATACAAAPPPALSSPRGADGGDRERAIICPPFPLSAPLAGAALIGVDPSSSQASTTLAVGHHDDTTDDTP